MDDSAKTPKDRDPTLTFERPDPPPPGDIEDQKVEENTAHRVFPANAFQTEAIPVAMGLGEADELPVEEDDQLTETPE